MRKRIIFKFLLFILIFSLNKVVAQDVHIKKDTSRVYRNIERFSKKSKFTKFLYRLVFRPVSTAPITTSNTNHNHSQIIYKDYEGKIIRNIKIVTINPFGYTLKDTSVTSQYFLPRTGNKLHVGTQQVTIRNMLLISKGKPFDSLRVKESERLIRSKNYIHDVLFTFDTTRINQDSVDISIRVLDEWSIIPEGALSPTHTKIGLQDKNLAGLGHNFNGTYDLNQTNGKQSISADYLIPNFRNTYISTMLSYQSDEENHYRIGIDVERPFYSPLAKWAGGLLFSQQSFPRNLINNENNNLLFTSRANTIDAWGAESWQVFRGNSVDKRTTKLILSARFYNIQYLDKPLKQFDTLNNYRNEHLYLAGLGINTREYVKDKYVFNFGVPEDVPVGRTYGITGGYEFKNSVLWYWGARYAFGNYFPLGYFSSNLEYGTFINASETQQGVFNVDVNYFTRLFRIGNWKLRQFVKPEFTIGLKRLKSDTLTLYESQGISGFNSRGLTGTQRLILKFQTQSYAPWNLVGFRFGPYFIFSLGMLGNSYSGFRYSTVYTQIGIGALIRNDYWVISTFQISFAYYPSIPGNGENIFKTDKFRTTDFGFIDFDLGKPGVVAFQ
jgi:hypothetical protein